MTHFRIFGQEAFVHIPKIKRKKFDDKSVKMIFVGYDSNSKAYRMLQKNNRIHISRDVTFIKQGSIENSSDTEENYTDKESKENSKELIQKDQEKYMFIEFSQPKIKQQDTDDLNSSFHSFIDENVYDEETNQQRQEPEEPEINQQGQEPETNQPEQELRRSERITKGIPPTRYINQIQDADPVTYEEAICGPDRESCTSLIQL